MSTIIFDTETTGLLAPDIVDLNRQPYITEFYGVKLDENLEFVEEFETFVKPPVPISEEITRITGIDDDTVKNAPEFIEIYRPLAKFFKGADRAVAHNCTFDKDMLINELSRHDLEYSFPWVMNWVCTVEASYAINNRRMSQGNLYRHVTGNYISGAHRARNDVEALVECYRYLVKEGLV